MDDTTFFKEEAERFRSQACGTADQTVQSTLMSLSSGLAEYADKLEQRGVKSHVAADQPDGAIAAHGGNDLGLETVAEEEKSPSIAADQTIDGEKFFVVAVEGNLTDEDWSAEGDMESEAGSNGVAEKCLFFAAILAPSLGVFIWTLLNRGR